MTRAQGLQQGSREGHMSGGLGAPTAGCRVPKVGLPNARCQSRPVIQRPYVRGSGIYARKWAGSHRQRHSQAQVEPAAEARGGRSGVIQRSLSIFRVLPGQRANRLALLPLLHGLPQAGLAPLLQPPRGQAVCRSQLLGKIQWPGLATPLAFDQWQRRRFERCARQPRTREWRSVPICQCYIMQSQRQLA